MSSSQTQDRETVLCHGCDNEWWRDEHGLICPRCHCDIVEIVSHRRSSSVDDEAYNTTIQINPNDDPRQEHLPSPQSDNPDSLPRHPIHDHNPLHNHNPWTDPDEEDIDHVAFSPAPGVHFERTFIRSGGARVGQRTRSPNDEVMGSFLQAFGGLLQGANNPTRPGGPPQARSVVFTTGSQPPFATRNPFVPPHHHPHHPQHHNHGPWSPNATGAGRNTWTAEERIFPEDMPHGNSNHLTGINAMMQVLLTQMNGNMGASTAQDRQRDGPAPGAGAGLSDILRHMFDPGNAVHGDGVFTQEAFDRILGEMMDNNGGSNAPGPASAAAIAALPKRIVDKSMMGSDGQAECSVCMDNVEIGDEVTTLPCKHWFHEQCVGIWLKEHDTCPHCRKGIMPTNGETAQSQPPAQPQAPTQPPRPMQNPFGPPPTGMANSSATQPFQAPFTQPGMQHPYVPGGYPTYPEPQSFVQSQSQHHHHNHNHQQQPPPPPHLQPRRVSRHSSSSSTQRHNNAEGSSSSSNGVSGWFRNLRSGRNSES